VHFNRQKGGERKDLKRGDPNNWGKKEKENGKRKMEKAMKENHWEGGNEKPRGFMYLAREAAVARKTQTKKFKFYVLDKGRKCKPVTCKSVWAKGM